MTKKRFFRLRWILISTKKFKGSASDYLVSSRTPRFLKRRGTNVAASVFSQEWNKQM